MKLRKMKRGEFEKGQFGKVAFDDVALTTALVQLALDHGVPLEAITATLEANRPSWPAQIVKGLIDDAKGAA